MNNVQTASDNIDIFALDGSDLEVIVISFGDGQSFIMFVPLTHKEN